MVLNTTLTHLSLSKLVSTAPFISKSKFHGSFSFLGKDLQFSKSSSQFFYSNSGKINLELSKSKFSHFLSPALQISSINIENRTFRNDGFKYVDDSYVNISFCIFEYCQNQNTNGFGGAITVEFPQDIYPKLEFNVNIFKNCSASRGGAIFAGGNDPMLNKNCFICCSAERAHNAIAIYSTKEYAIMDLCTFAYCPGKKASSQSVLSFLHKLAILKVINSTYNEIDANGVFLYSVRNDNVYMRYINIQGCRGKSGFVLRNTSTMSLSFLFIFNNTLIDPFITMQKDNQTSITLSKSIFLLNSYQNDTNPAVLESNTFKLKISDSNIDPQSIQALGKSAEITSNTGSLHYISETAYYNPTGCQLYKAPTTYYSKFVLPKMTMAIIIGIASLIAIIVVFVIIFSYVARIKGEEEWITEFNSRLN